MSILFVDSASYCDDPGFGTKYAITTSGLQSSILPGRYGGYCIFLFNTAFGSWRAIKALPSRNTLRYHASFRAHTSGAALYPNSRFGGFGVPGTKLLSWKIDSSQTLKLYTGGTGANSNLGTLLLTSVATFPFDQWRTIEIEATFGPSGTLALYVDDVLDSSLTNVLWATNSNANQFEQYWESFGLQGIEWCDVVVSDDLGTVNNQRLGPCQVVCDFPIADATVPQWIRNTDTSDANCVNEQNGALHGAPNFNFNYIDGPDGAIDLFTVATPRCFGRNLAVAANACAVNGDVLMICRPAPSSTMLHPVGGSVSPGPAYFTLQQIQELSYLSGTYWTDREIGQAWWGMESIAGPRVTQFFLEKVTSLRPVPFSCGGGSYVI